MSEETKKTPEAELPEEETPKAQAAPSQEKPLETGESETIKNEKAEKSKKESKKKEKTYTLTREQMEAAELAVKQLESARDQFIRLSAEYDNYRKRTAKEKDGIYQDAKADTIREFLAVYDNLERAMATEGGGDSPHKKGLEMILGQFKGILEKLGVTEMQAKGEPFDPNRHNAVMHIDDETLGENVVADVYQSGFLLGDRVLRFATVRVAN